MFVKDIFTGLIIQMKNTAIVGEVIKFTTGNDVHLAIAILIGSFIFAKITEYLIFRHLKKLTEKTKTEMDDVILEMMAKPVQYLIIFIGFYLASQAISNLIPFFEKVTVMFFVLGVLLCAWIITKVLNVLIFYWFKEQKKIERVPEVLNKLVGIFIFTIAILMILERFHIALSPLVATLGVGSLAIGLALQSTLSDFFAGMHILSDRPIRVGDFVELEDGTMGYVDDIGWRSTKIRALGDYTIIIPNSKLAESKITNYCLPVKPTNIVVECGVSYEDDLEKVEKVTLEVAKKIQENVDGAVKNWEPIMRYKEFGDSNINFIVVLRAKNYVHKFKMVHEFIKELKKRYDEEGINISWPVRLIYFGNEMPKEK